MLIAAGLFVLAFWRAIEVPLTQDEVNNFFEFALPFHVDLFSPPYSANNHFLNTLLTGLFVHFFGAEQWILRLANLLSFPLFAFGIWKLGANLQLAGRWALIFALLGNYFVFEFFSFSRGYGMSIAFLVTHMAFLWAYIVQPTGKRFAISVVFLALALAANLTLMVYSMAILGYLLVELISKREWRSRKGLLLLFLSIWIFLAALAAFRLRVTGELYWGSQDGFFETTVLSLLNNLRLNQSFLVFSVLGFASLVMIYPFTLLRALGWRQWLRTPSIVLSGLFICLCAAPVLMNWLLGVNFPYERAAMYFIPVFWISVLAAINKLPKARLRIPVTLCFFLASLYFPVEFTRIARADYSHAEPFGNLPTRFYDEIHQHADKHRIDLPVVQGDGRMSFVWEYMDYMDLDHGSNFREQAFDEDYQLTGVKTGQGILLDSHLLGDQKLYLYWMDRQMQLLNDTSFARDSIVITEEYSNLLDSDSLVLAPGLWEIIIELQAPELKSDSKLHVAVQCGVPENSQSVPLKRAINHKKGQEVLRCKFQIMSPDAPSIVKVFAWMPKRENQTLKRIRVYMANRA